MTLRAPHLVQSAIITVLLCAVAYQRGYLWELQREIARPRDSRVIWKIEPVAKAPEPHFTVVIAKPIKAGWPCSEMDWAANPKAICVEPDGSFWTGPEGGADTSAMCSDQQYTCGVDAIRWRRTK